MVLFYELTQQGMSHAPFTRAFVQMVAHACPDEELTIYGQPSHLECALGEPDPMLDGRLTKLPYTPPSAHPRDFWKLMGSALMFLHRTYGPVADQQPQVIFLTGQPHHIWAAKLYRMITPGFRCHLVMHGDIHAIRGWRSRNPLVRLRDYVTAIGRANHPAVRLVALETHIRSNVDAAVPGSAAFIDVIRHPCMPAQVDWQSPIPAAQELRFGLLGIAGKSKGLDVFARLALRTREHAGAVQPRRAEFRLIGKLQKDADQLDLSAIGGPLPFSKEWLPREVFDSELAQLHYVVLPYNMDYYGLSASGVLLDVLRWRKPVVAFDTPVVRELAERFGDIGYICADEDEMAAVVQRLLAGHDPQRYQAQRRNLDAAYRSRLPDAAALEYRGMRQACWNPTLKMA
jgi:glycosyltransferase involved in cell wall biosynthesis